MPPAEDSAKTAFSDAPATVPGVRHPRTTLPLPAPPDDPAARRDEWPNDAVRPVWDREETAVREAPLTEEQRALLRGDEPPTAAEVLAAMDQVQPGPPVSRTPTLTGIPAADAPSVQSGSPTLTGIPARVEEETAPVRDPAAPVMGLEYLETIPVPPPQPLPAAQPPANDAAAEFADDKDDKTPLPAVFVPFGGDDSGVRRLPSGDEAGQAPGQAAVSGLTAGAALAPGLDSALRSAEPEAPEIAPEPPAAPAAGEPAPPASDAASAAFDQAPPTQPGVVVGGRFVPGIRSMMTEPPDDKGGEDPESGKTAVVRGYIPFESSGVSNVEDLDRGKPQAPPPEKVFPPPLPLDARPEPIKLITLAARASQQQLATAPTAPMDTVQPALPPASEPLPAPVEPVAAVPVPVSQPADTAPPPAGTPPAVQPAAEIPPPADEPVPPPAGAPAEPVLSGLTDKPAPSLFLVPPPSADFQSEAAAGMETDADADLTEMVRGLKRRDTLRWLPWTLAGMVAVLFLVGLGLGVHLYKVKDAESDQSEFSEAMATCAQERVRRKHVSQDVAAKECAAVAGRLLK